MARHSCRSCPIAELRLKWRTSSAVPCLPFCCCLSCCYFCRMQFIDDDTGEKLIEFVEGARLRPALPTSAKFTSWDQLQVIGQQTCMVGGNHTE